MATKENTLTIDREGDSEHYTVTQNGRIIRKGLTLEQVLIILNQPYEDNAD